MIKKMDSIKKRVDRYKTPNGSYVLEKYFTNHKKKYLTYYSLPSRLEHLKT